MLVQFAEESYQRGLHCLKAGRIREAQALFEAAIELERRLGHSRPQARYLSFYGLCLGHQRQQLHEALRFCRQAVSLEGFNPDLRCNLGRVLMRAGQKREAHKTLMRGLSLQPDHPGLRRVLRSMGVRRRPVIPFLARGNLLNQVLGRLRSGVA